MNLPARKPPPERKPEWFKVPAPGGERFERLRQLFRAADLHTVCEEAHCPNIGECWREGTATLMLLGDVCTRGCRFCAVTSGKPPAADPHEPQKVADALAQMQLAYVVLTMVDRDDMPDGGAAHVAETVRRIKQQSPDTLVETLVGDFAGARRDIETVLAGGPDVFAHNVEVVPRLQRAMRDGRCSWERSVDVLRAARDAGANITKSSIMLGCGETQAEVEEALTLLHAAGVDVVTLGQYLRPGRKYAPIQRYVTPDEFAHYREFGLNLGLKYVASGPLVRSSYRAAEAFLKGVLKGAPSTYDDQYGKRRTHLTVVN